MDGLSEQEKAILQGKLLEQRETLRSLLEASAGNSKPVQLDQQALGRVSRIDAIQQQSMAIANRTTQELTLRQITKALRRIQEDRYGYCLECDQYIPCKRLLIKPETTLCIQCQSIQETNI